jgi:hypothetical protein
MHINLKFACAETEEQIGWENLAQASRTQVWLHNQYLIS